jgi:hypothetical protein
MKQFRVVEGYAKADTGTFASVLDWEVQLWDHPEPVDSSIRFFAH